MCCYVKQHKDNGDKSDNSATQQEICVQIQQKEDSCFNEHILNINMKNLL